MLDQIKQFVKKLLRQHGEFIFKTLVIVACAIILLVLVLILYCDFIEDYNMLKANDIRDYIILPLGILGFVIVTTYTFLPIDFKTPRSVPFKFQLTLKSFDDVVETVKPKILADKFILLDEFERDGVKYFAAYRKEYLDKLDVIIFAGCEEATNKILDEYESVASTEVYNVTGMENPDPLSVIHCLCVKRLTPALNKVINKSPEQGIRNYHLPMVISFGGDKLYIPKQKGGFSRTKYNKLKKYAEYLFDVTEETNKK